MAAFTHVAQPPPFNAGWLDGSAAASLSPTIMTDRAPMPASLRADEQDSILRSRLAVPERPLRVLLKKLSLIVGASGEVELAQAIASFQLELEAFVLHLQRVEAVANKTTVAEVRAYQDKVASMDQERVETLESIELLKKELVYVQQDRKNKLEYDALASEIMKYGTREELETQLTTLQTTLDSLSGESAKYSEIMAQSKSRFEGIADNLKKLRADVGFEVGERERREVEREGEGDVEEEVRAGEEAVEAATAAASAATTAPAAMDDEEREGEGEGQGKGNRSALNPSAAVFKPNESSRASTPGATASNRGSAGAKRRRTARRAGDEEEEEGGAQKRPREEGEMSDADDEEEEGAA